MRPRPRIAYASPRSRDEILADFREAVVRPHAPCVGNVGSKEISLYMQDAQRTRWSPWLSLEIGEHEGQTLLKGRMGPEPQLWTLFVFVYASLLVGVTAGSIYGLVQWTLGDEPTGWMYAAGFLLGLSTACGADLLGRRIGEAQMGVIRGFVLGVVPKAIEVSDAHKV